MWVIFYLSYVRHYHFLLQIHLFLLHTVYELQLALPQERLVNSQLGSILVQTWDFIIPNFQSWVLFGAMLGIYFAEKIIFTIPNEISQFKPKLSLFVNQNWGWLGLILSSSFHNVSTLEPLDHNMGQAWESPKPKLYIVGGIWGNVVSFVTAWSISQHWPKHSLMGWNWD